jgi:regulator of PEP synthase PpsR (kinase-PPPase family)
MIAQQEETDYVNPSTVREEVAMARRLFTQRGWPVIDVTRRSIEEIAATIMNHLASRRVALDEDALS